MSRAPHIESAGRTEVGRCRSINEDVFALRPDVGLYLVLDGMGGHAAGELAAAIAAETMQRFYEDGGAVWPLDAPGKASSPQAFLVAAAKLANTRIRERTAREPDSPHNSTTFRPNGSPPTRRARPSPSRSARPTVASRQRTTGSTTSSIFSTARS